MKDVLLAKYVTKIGTWNVRTAYSTGKLAQVINEIKTARLHILGSAEMRWQNSRQLVSDEVMVLYSGDSKHELEMWANAQRDGCPAECRWRPLFNAAKFG